MLCQNSDLSLIELFLNRKGRRGFRRETQRKAFLDLCGRLYQLCGLTGLRLRILGFDTVSLVLG